MPKVMFHVHRYDRDGDMYDPGLYLVFGDTSVRVASTLVEFEGFMKEMEQLHKEVTEHFYDDLEEK